MRDGAALARRHAPDDLRRVDGVHAAALLAFAILVSCFLTSDFRSFMLRSIAIVELSWGLKRWRRYGAVMRLSPAVGAASFGVDGAIRTALSGMNLTRFPLTHRHLVLIMASLLAIYCAVVDPFLRIFPPPWKGATLIPCCNIWG